MKILIAIAMLWSLNLSAIGIASSHFHTLIQGVDIKCEYAKPKHNNDRFFTILKERDDDQNRSTIDTDIQKIRQAFQQISESEKSISKFYALTVGASTEEGTVVSAYYGLALALKASIAESTLDKLKYFKQGKKRIEAAIIADPNDIELRMIRLSVQWNAPKILRYSKHIEEDKAFIQNHINTLNDAALKALIIGFMETSPAFTTK